MMRYAVLLATFCATPAVWAGVVINEIFYNGPEDLEDLQWIEFYNNGDVPVDLSGWKLDKGSVFVFPAATRIGAHEYLVAALDPDRFTESYGGRAIGPLKRPLKRGGERIELADTAGRRIDVARYKDVAPWPVSPDGYTASLERICPSAPGDVPENWAASPLSAVDTKPNGTPGRQNVSHSGTLPPVIEIVSGTPDDLRPEQPLRVEAEVTGREAPRGDVAVSGRGRRRRRRGYGPSHEPGCGHRTLSGHDPRAEDGRPHQVSHSGPCRGWCSPTPSGGT